jgi:WD40 repeat protein
VADPDFLLAVDPDRLSRLLPGSVSEDARSNAAAYLRAREWIGGPVEDSASYLQLAARQVGAEDLAEEIASRRLLGAWSVPWARWRPESPHLVLARSFDPIEAIAFARLSGVLRVFSAHRNGLRQWGTPPRGGWTEIIAGSYEDAVVGLAIGQVGSRWLLASVETEQSDARVILHDVTSEVAERFSWWVPPDRWPNTAAAFGRLENDVVLAVGNGQGTVAVWSLDPTGGEELLVLSGHEARVTAVAAGDSIVVSGAEDGTLCLWRLGGDASTVCAPRPVHTEEVWDIAICRGRDGREFLVSAGADDLVEILWDFSAQTWHSEALCQGFGIGRLAVVEQRGAPLLVTGGRDELVRVWDLAERSQLHVLIGHSDTVTGVASDVTDHQMVVSAGLDGTIRMWQPDRVGADVSDHTRIHADTLAVGQSSDGDVIAYGTSEGSLTVLNAETGQRLQWCAQVDSVTGALAVARFKGSPVVVAGSEDGAVRMYDLATGHEATEPLRGLDAAVVALAVSDDSRYLVAKAAGDPSLAAWDLDAGEFIRTYPGAACGILALAVVDAQPVVMCLARGEDRAAGRATASARLLDIETGVELQTAIVELPQFRPGGIYTPWPQETLGVARAGDHWLAIYGIEDRRSGMGAGSWLVWDPARSESAVRQLSPLPVGPFAVGPMHGSTMIARGNRFGSITLSGEDGRDRLHFQVGADVERLCLLPPGTLVASTSAGLLAVDVTAWPADTVAAS